MSALSPQCPSTAVRIRGGLAERGLSAGCPAGNSQDLTPSAGPACLTHHLPPALGITRWALPSAAARAGLLLFLAFNLLLDFCFGSAGKFLHLTQSFSWCNWLEASSFFLLLPCPFYPVSYSQPAGLMLLPRLPNPPALVLLSAPLSQRLLWVSMEGNWDQNLTHALRSLALHQTCRTSCCAATTSPSNAALALLSDPQLTMQMSVH